jgi:hypothetical protein
MTHKRRIPGSPTDTGWRLEDFPPTHDGRARFPEGAVFDIRLPELKVAVDAAGVPQGLVPVPLPAALAHSPNPKQVPPVRGRAVPQRMNKTERRYADRLTHDGRVLEWWFEEWTFKIGPDLRYTPDFVLVTTDFTFEVHEVKGGYAREDARAKFLVAAERYPLVFRWAVYKAGGWTITTPYSEDR